jgi:hypothetical protein
MGADPAPAPPSETRDWSPCGRSSPDGGGNGSGDANWLFLAGSPRALRPLADGGEPLSALVSGGTVGTHPPALASARGSHHFLRLSWLSVTVVLEKYESVELVCGASSDKYVSRCAIRGKGNRVLAGWATEGKILLRTDVCLVERGYALGSDHR